MFAYRNEGLTNEKKNQLKYLSCIFQINLVMQQNSERMQFGSCTGAKAQKCSDHFN